MTEQRTFSVRKRDLPVLSEVEGIIGSDRDNLTFSGVIIEALKLWLAGKTGGKM